MEHPPSVLGRLLSEVSWEGNARHYREGGRGFENVLTAEVFQALDFLPRRPFLERVITSVHGGASDTLELLQREIEEATFRLLPDALFLGRGQLSPIKVQPDGIIESDSVYCLLEVKRLKAGSFQREQIAREVLATVKEAQSRRRSPLLLLILPEDPPVLVRGMGRVSIRDAIGECLESLVQKTGDSQSLACEILDKSDSLVAYLT